MINGKTYIGQHITCNLNDGYIGSGSSLIKAVKKYGKENFKCEHIFYAINLAALNFLEKCLVPLEWAKLKTNYNLKEGGGSKGKPTEEVKVKLSLARKGRTPMKGHRHSNDTKRRMSLAHKGSKHYLYGKSHTKETIDKISKTKKQNMTEERRIQLSNSHKKKSIPALINILTGQIYCGEIGIRPFARKHNLDDSALLRVISGVAKSHKGFELYKGEL